MCVRYACGLLSWYMRARLGVGLDGRLLLGDGCRQWKPNKIEWLLPRTDCTPVCACVRCEVWGVSALGVLCARMRGGGRKAVACTATRTQGYACDCRCERGGGIGGCGGGGWSCGLLGCGGARHGQVAVRGSAGDSVDVGAGVSAKTPTWSESSHVSRWVRLWGGYDVHTSTHLLTRARVPHAHTHRHPPTWAGVEVMVPITTASGFSYGAPLPLQPLKV